MDEIKRITCIIQARTDSTRLPNKVLKEIENVPMIHHIINRIKRSKKIDQIVLATTDNDSDKILLDIAKNLEIIGFAGEQDDVLGRFYDAAKLFSADPIIRITGDCPLVDSELLDIMIEIFLENKYLKFSGLNLSVETLEGLLKHNGPVEDFYLVDELIGVKKFKNMINFNTFPSLEAQISSISDDIAYNNHDIQDGIKANLFRLEELVEIDFFKNIYRKYKKKINKKNYKIATYQIIRDSIDLMIKDLMI